MKTTKRTRKGKKTNTHTRIRKLTKTQKKRTRKGKKANTHTRIRKLTKTQQKEQGKARKQTRTKESGN
jgi:hypothetical protein